MSFSARNFRFFLILFGNAVLFSLFNSLCYCAPNPQEDARPAISATQQPESAISAPNRSVSNSLPRHFQALPFQILFKDQAGVPQIIIPYADFEELEKIIYREDRKSLEPSYSLQKIEASGQVEGQIARIRFDITLSTSNDSLVSVPIGLREGVCLLPAHDEPITEETEKPHQLEYTGKGSCDLTVDPQNGNYVLLVRNPAQTETEKAERQNWTHDVSFTLFFPVENVGQEEQRLRISCPLAVSSRLILTVPMNEAVATDAQGLTIIRPAKPVVGGGTQFELIGFSKLLDLSWYRQIQSQPKEKQMVVQVEDAKILVRMTPRETVFDATLPVRSVGGPLQRFRIRLPSQTRLIADPLDGTPSTEYQIREITPQSASENQETENTGANAEAQQTETNAQSPLLEVEVTGSSKQDTILPIRIRAVRSFSAEAQSSWSELGGFEVLGAERQSGHVEINVLDDLNLSLRNLHGVREEDNVDATKPLEGTPRNEKSVRFVYFTQPFSLEARVVFPQTRISVKPEYQVVLDKGQIFLTGKIQATVSGSRTNQLQWNFYDWHLDEIGPSSIVDSSGIVREEGEENRKKGTTTIPLRADGPIELKFTATRPMLPMIDQKTTVDLMLPLPIADRMEPATIVIVPADNLELPLAGQEIVGMSRINRNVPLNPPRQQEPLVFRSDIPIDLTNFAMSFHSDVILHKQEVFASSRTVVRILEQKDQLEQAIQFNVKFEPMDQLTLLIPSKVNDNGSLKLYFDDKVISESGRTSSPDTVAGTDMVRRRIFLPNPLIGNGTLLLRYSMGPTEIKREMTTRIPVPQILPMETEIVEQTVIVSAPGGVNILLADGNSDPMMPRKIPADFSITSSDSDSPDANGDTITSSITTEAEKTERKQELKEAENRWRKIEKNGATSTGLQDTFFSAASWETSIQVAVQLDYMDVLGTTVVERAWVQTWLSDRIRVDQASFRIRSDHEKIPVILPTGFDRNHVAVSWDNVQIPFQYEEKAIVIMQPKEQRSQSHLLVVKYQMQIPGETLSNRLKIELPSFNSEVWVRRMYWQVIFLQKNKHIFGDCPGWTPEFYWNWNGLYWMRNSSLDQEELELWIGSLERQELKDSPETSQYLYSSFNPQHQCELYIIDRKQLVLFSSGIVLMLGFALIYFSWLRRVGVIFTLVVLFVSIFFYQPTPAILVLQASILGIVMSLITAVLARITYREPDWKYTPQYNVWNTAPQDDVAPFVPPPTSELPEVIIDSTHHKSSSVRLSELPRTNDSGTVPPDS